MLEVTPVKISSITFLLVGLVIGLPITTVQAENINDDAVAELCHSRFDDHTGAYNRCKGLFLDGLEQRQRGQADEFYNSITGQSDSAYRNQVRSRQLDILDELGSDRPRYRNNSNTSYRTKKYHHRNASKCNVTLSGNAHLTNLICN
jgi:hypothetical protein